MYPSVIERLDTIDGPARREAPYCREATDSRHWSEHFQPSEMPPHWDGRASTIDTTASPAPRRWHAQLASSLARLWSSLRRTREQRRAMLQLERLDERELNDIGISRCDIVRVARGGKS